MSHLDILERTRDRLVLRWHTPASENIVLGIVIAATVGFLGFAVYFLVTNFDWLLFAGTLLGGAFVTRMALMKRRVILDTASDRIEVSRPLAWRWGKLSTYSVRVDVKSGSDGHVGVLRVGSWSIASTEPRATAEAAREALAEDVDLLQAYQPG